MWLAQDGGKVTFVTLIHPLSMNSPYSSLGLVCLVGHKVLIEMSLGVSARCRSAFP